MNRDLGLLGKLFVVFSSMLLSQLVASAFNIGYNVIYLRPLLSDAQQVQFEKSVGIYNLSVYPPLMLVWFLVVFSLREKQATPSGLLKQQRLVIRLPVWGAALSFTGWLLTIPALLYAISKTPDPLTYDIVFNLSASVLLSTIVAVSLGYLVMDWSRMWLLYPYFFDRVSPSRIAKVIGLSVMGRGVLWTISSSVCPVLALLLLFLLPSSGSNVTFAIVVSCVGIGFAFVTAVIIARLVAKPVRELEKAAIAVGLGDTTVAVDNLRADEFGVLADEFNKMVEGLRERERIAETFGRHVGVEVARELLEKKEDLSGVERDLSVLFVDIRDFTTLCESLDPQHVVTLLNTYYGAMTEVVTENNGMVNKLIGDGMMVLFGATGEKKNHAEDAVTAGIAMVKELVLINSKLELEGFDPIDIGVGIHSGAAVIGTIGSPGRMEYTAIGDTINTAARIEGMTKKLQHALLISEDTYSRLTEGVVAEKLSSQMIRGRSGEIVLYGIDCSIS